MACPIPPRHTGGPGVRHEEGKGGDLVVPGVCRPGFVVLCGIEPGVLGRLAVARPLDQRGLR